MDSTTPGWAPRLVALDIDGTVLGFDGSLREDARASVQRVIARGVPVVLATGRGWYTTRPVFDDLGLVPGLAVSSNGAVIVKYPPLEVVVQETFDAAPAVRAILERAPQVCVAVEVLDRGYRVNRAFPDGDLAGEITIQDLDDLVAEPVTRVVIRDPDASMEDFGELARSLGLHDVEYFVGYSQWLDIAPPGVNKARGLTSVIESLGVDVGDVLAIGDGENDIEMLEWAGRGVAMGQANEKVIAAADDVTAAHDEGGLAQELERWFPQA